MKKIVKKIVALAVCACSIVSMTACRSGGMVEIDASKSQLYVGVYDGGYGCAWAENWAKDFMEANKDTVFEEGKKGCQIQVSVSKSYAQDGITTSLKNQNDDIVFTEQANYYDFIRNKTALDITEWITSPLSEYGEDRSIADKLSPLDKEYYQQSSVSPKYYGVPWYVSFPCISYDMQLFEDSLLYFAADGEGDEQGFIFDETTPRSKGPDGKTGIIGGIDYSLDDGLPATYDQFFLMCDRIVDCGKIPFIWAGGVRSYVNNLFSSLVATVEGYDNMLLNYTFDGTAKDLIKSVNDAVVEYEEATQITDTNGYLLRKQKGNYYALKFLQRLIATENVDGTPKYYDYDTCFSSSTSHIGAQTKFLQSRYKADGIAMLIDGTWWYSEAKDTFNAMSGYGDASQQNRRIGIMSLPQPEAGQEKDTTLMNTWTTSVVVRGNINENVKPLARAFYRYMHTDACLSSYIKEAFGIRPFNHDLVNLGIDDLPTFTAQQYNLYQNYKTVNPYSTAPIMRNFLTTINGDYSSLIGNSQYTLIIDAFRDGVSAEDYFLGMQKYMTETSWHTKFNTGYID